MDGGAAVSKVQEGVQAAEKLTPLAAQYPMAFALLLVAGFAVGCIFIFYRRDVARSKELTDMIAVNRDQAATLEVMSNQLDSVPLIITTLAVMAQLMGMEVAKTQLDVAAAEAKTGKEALKKRRRMNTGAVTALPDPATAPGGKEGV